MKALKLLILLPILLLLTACPEDDPVKPDPCDGKKPVTAEFKIKQRIIDVLDSKQELNIETESVLTYREITFEAEGDYDNYEWQLGDDPNIKSGKKITYNFTKVWGKLQMRLIVKGKRDTLCFPDDDGIDTIIKPVFVIDRKDVKIQGSYQGYHNDNHKDTFTVDINFEGDDRGLVIYNINRGCILPPNLPGNNIENDFTNNFIVFNGGSDYSFGCLSPKGTAMLQKDMKTIIIDYEAGPQNDRKIYKFIGVKK